MPSVYAKIDFLRSQCLAFSGHREQKLLKGMAIRLLYVGVDRQEYVVNWTKREDNKASMHGIDRFFMQVRRKLSLLERPFATASAGRRIWHGYSAYNPESIINLLDIFRIYYNYCLKGKDGKTPAMRLGLARGVVTHEDIIYYKQRRC